MKIKVAIIFVLTVLLYSSNVYSQETDEQNSTCISKDALSFYLINTLGVGYKLAHGSGFYSGLFIDADFSISNSDMDRTNTTINTDQTNTTSTNSETDATAFSFDVTYLFLNDIIQNERLILYWGVGPLIGYSYSKTEQNFGGELYFDSFSTTERNSFSLGARAAIGIEAKVSEMVYLFAESRFNAERVWLNEKADDRDEIQQGIYITNKREADINIWQVGLNKIIIGVGIYF